MYISLQTAKLTGPNSVGIGSTAVLEMEVQLQNISAYVGLEVFTNQNYAISVCSISVTHIGANFNKQEMVDDFHAVLHPSDYERGNDRGSIILGRLDNTGTNFTS